MYDFVTISFLIMGSNFKIMFVMVAMTVFCLNTSDIAIITVKNVDYRYIIHDINKSEAINLLENSVLEDHGYICKKYCQTFALV